MSSPTEPTPQPNPLPQAPKGPEAPPPQPRGEKETRAQRTGSAGWRTGEPKATPADSGRGARLFVALALFVAAAGAVAGLLFWIQPSEPLVLLTFPVTEYTDSAWPPNPWAEEDSDALQGAFSNLASQEKAYGFLELGRLQSKLRALRDYKSGQPVVLHLTALAAVYKGEVYIIPADGKSGDHSTWLRLDSLLDALFECPSKHRLLLLDLAHPTANLFHGPLADSVSDRLDEQLRIRVDAGKLPYFVLTSCSKNELSLPMDEEQQSAFMFYVSDGLRGSADGFGPTGQRDGRVRVSELADFVKRRVARWARDCRGISQTPKFYDDAGRLSDFDLTDRRLPPPEPKEPRTYADWLFAGWQRRDEWLSKQAFRPAPIAVNGLQIALPRAEQDWQAVGRAERIVRVDANLRSAVEKANSDCNPARLDTPLRSILAWQPQPTPPDEWSSLLETFLTTHTSGATNPKDAEKAKEDRAKFLEKVKTTPETRKAAAALIWRRLIDDFAPKIETVADLSPLLDEVLTGLPVSTKEAQAARRLATWQRPGGLQWPPGAVRQFLHTEDAANRALATGPDAFPAAGEIFVEAARLQNEGETVLFDPKYRPPEERAGATDTLKRAEDKFVAAAARMTLVQSARRACEDAAIVLTATATSAADDGGTTERTWLAAAKAASDLNDRLESSTTSIDVGDWESLTGQLVNQLQKIREPYQPAVVKRKVENWASGRAPEFQALRDLLRGPMCMAAERKRVWETAQSIGMRIHKQTRDADVADDDSRRPPGTNRNPDPPLKDESERRERRAGASIELLRVAGLDHIDDLDKIRRAALADAKLWDSLAVEIRKNWKERLQHLAEEYRNKSAWPAADRRERFLSPDQSPRGLPAATAIRAWDRKQYLLWLDKYYRDLGRLREADPRISAFYEDAAKDARRALGD